MEQVFETSLSVIMSTVIWMFTSTISRFNRGYYGGQNQWPNLHFSILYFSLTPLIFDEFEDFEVWKHLFRYSEFIKAQNDAYCVLLLFAHFIFNKQSA